MVLRLLKRKFIRLLICAILVLLLRQVVIYITETNFKAFFRKHSHAINTSWDYLPCDWRVDNIPRPMRHRAVLECTNSSARIFYEEVPFNTIPVVTTLESHDPCLAHLAQSTWCNDPGMRVPRLVHYVWFARHVLPLYTFVSVLSAVRHVRPCLVLFHGDHLPEGPYWHALLQLVPNIVHVRSKMPRQIFGHEIRVVEHSADVTRLQVLLDYGGIYLDTDQIVLKSLDHMRVYPVTMATEFREWNLGNAMILSEKRATFLALWLGEYNEFDEDDWSYHSTRVPYKLYYRRPDLVHVVHSFFRPNYASIGKFYQSGVRYKWNDLLALHLYARLYESFYSTVPSAVRCNCTIGGILQYSLHGAADACWVTTVVNGNDTSYLQDDELTQK